MGEEPGSRSSKTAARGDPTWRTVCRNLAAAYAVAIVFTTYLSPPNEIPALLLGPLLLVAVAGIFGLAAVGVVHLRRDFYRRFRPSLVWLVSTWIALILMLLDPFLPTLPFESERTQAPAKELGRGVPD